MVQLPALRALGFDRECLALGHPAVARVGRLLIPTVVGGKVISNDEAITEYRRTGRHLGKFKDAASASAFAEQLHQAEAKRVSASFDPAAVLRRLSPGDPTPPPREAPPTDRTFDAEAVLAKLGRPEPTDSPQWVNVNLKKAPPVSGMYPQATPPKTWVDSLLSLGLLTDIPTTDQVADAAKWAKEAKDAKAGILPEPVPEAPPVPMPFRPHTADAEGKPVPPVYRPEELALRSKASPEHQQHLADLAEFSANVIEFGHDIGKSRWKAAFSEGMNQILGLTDFSEDAMKQRARYSQAIAAVKAKLNYEGKTGLGSQIAFDALGSIIGSSPGVVASVLGGGAGKLVGLSTKAAGATGMVTGVMAGGAQAGLLAYGQALQNGEPREQAWLRAVAAAKSEMGPEFVFAAMTGRTAKSVMGKLLAGREAGKAKEIVKDLVTTLGVETANEVSQMTPIQFLARFGEASRVLRHLDGSADSIIN
jgi:hypothetical protein